MTRALFISDLHLAVERPATTARFRQFLREDAVRAQALYILGDLFEYWIGDDGLEDDALARETADGLHALAASGVGVFLMHGNRDFLVGKRFCDAAGCELLDDPRVVELGGKPILLMHGDTLCTDDDDYQSWRRTCRAPAWQRAFLAQSLAERRETIRALREKSKAVNAAKTEDIMDVSAGAVSDAFRRHGVAMLIHGHTHRPARHAHEVDGRRCERWVLPDWYGPGGYLALDATGARLTAF